MLNTEWNTTTQLNNVMIALLHIKSKFNDTWPNLFSKNIRITVPSEKLGQGWEVTVYNTFLE